jgi:RNA polymerase sigma-70 factor (ECF subfamily)
LRPLRLAPLAEFSEDALASAIRQGDQDAFRAIFERYYVSLCAFAYGYVRSADRAEDVVQDVFAAVWRRHAVWEIQGTVQAYLFGAVRNRALRYAEKAALATQRHIPLSSAAKLPHEDSPERRVDAGETIAAVRDAVAELPERSRVLVTLRWQHEMTYGEIAHAMGISVKGVENGLQRAVKRLRKRLDWLREIDV